MKIIWLLYLKYIESLVIYAWVCLFTPQIENKSNKVTVLLTTNGLRKSISV